MSSGTLCADRHMIGILPPGNKLVFSDHLPTNDAVSLYLHDINDNNYPRDDSSSDPYAADHFRMYDFKVRRCTRSRSHDWTDCPFAHPAEKARRRDPRRFRYCSTVCSDYRRGLGCPRGDDCEFAHGVFECWLHPTRYRTEPCKDGKNCKRKVCFFAHSSRELRILSDLSPKYPTNSCSSPVIGDDTTGARCCLFCRSVSSPSASSPTSTLLGLSHFSQSPSPSPPMSPVAHQRRAATGFSPSKLGAEAVSYKEILSELVRSLEGIGISKEVCSPAVRSRNANGFLNLPLIQDLHGFRDQAVDLHDQAAQAVIPPKYCAQITDAGSGDDSFGILRAPAPSYNHDNDEEDYWRSKMKGYSKMKGCGNECGSGGDSDGGDGSADPDLGWVNDLLV